MLTEGLSQFIPRLYRHPAKRGWDSLTRAELKIVNMIARGETNRAVADNLHLSLHTVKPHVRNAFIKVDINSRARLSRWCPDPSTVEARHRLPPLSGAGARTYCLPRYSNTLNENQPASRACSSLSM